MRGGAGAMRAAPGGTRGRCRFPRRARASFVDESLFGSPAGSRPPPPAFAPPWAAPARGPGPRSHSRWRSRAPSFCEESLFGTRQDGPPSGAGSGAPGTGCSRSLSRLNAPSDRLCLASEGGKARGPPARGRSGSVSGSPLARSPAGAAGCKPRPPWK
ncbi:RBPJ-interacting and tubulin-associated protein 1 [Aegotheles albertisi]